MPVDPSDFRAVLGRFASGITVITARDAEGRDAGMTVSAFSSLSLEPPLILVCVDRAASAGPVIEAASHFAVNILSDEQEALSRRFSQKGVDRFEGVGFARSPHGPALLEGALATLECRVAARHPGGDHTILVGEVLDASMHEGHPLLYYRSGYRRLER
jgi:flavin reductase (DIM6/NTAB) family NADH-FMN oxidoreductase RutF